MIEFGDLLDIIEKYPGQFSKIKKTYIYLLSLLTDAPNFSGERFLTQVRRISQYGTIFVGYIKSSDDSIEIMATATLFIEPKIIHSAKSVGHVEDLVIHPDYRGQGVSKIILGHFKQKATEWGCYKVILNCDKELKGFYEKRGFSEKSIQMLLRIENDDDEEENGLRRDESNKKKEAYPLINACPYSKTIIKRNGFIDFSGKNDTMTPPNWYIYFTSVKDEEVIPYNETIESEKFTEVNAQFVKNPLYKKPPRILYIVHVIDLMQKFKFSIRENVDFLYISTISKLNDCEFQWEKDNRFLDKVIQDKYLKTFNAY